MERLLNTKDIAMLLGRSEGAIRNLVLRRQIPFRKVAGRLGFIKTEIEDWIKAAPGVRIEELNGTGAENSRRSYR